MSTNSTYQSRLEKDSIPVAGSASQVKMSFFDVGTRLRSLREAVGFSQRELAKRAGVTNSSISMIEQAQVSPSIQSLERVLSALGVSLVDFFSYIPLNRARILRFTTPEHLLSGDVSPSINTVMNNSACDQLDVRSETIEANCAGAWIVCPSDLSGVVVQGEICLVQSSHKDYLGVGDGFYIPRGQLYQLANHSHDIAKLFRCSVFTGMGK